MSTYLSFLKDFLFYSIPEKKLITRESVDQCSQSKEKKDALCPIMVIMINYLLCGLYNIISFPFSCLNYKFLRATPLP